MSLFALSKETRDHHRLGGLRADRQINSPDYHIGAHVFASSNERHDHIVFMY